MKEHALPQDVTGYKFHIIGNMTLKQFAEVAGGVAIGFLIYFTNLPTIIKWPLILTFAGIGALAAFVPFEERPLDHWILALFKALYRPTQFYWKRLSKIPEPFLYETKKELNTLVKEVDLTPARRQRVKEYMHSVVPTQEIDQIEEYSNQRLNEIMTVFEQNPVAVPEGVVQNAEPVMMQPTPETTVEIPQPAQAPQPEAATIPTLQSQLGSNQPAVTMKGQEKADPNAYVPLAISQGFVSGVDVKTAVNAPDRLLNNDQNAAATALGNNSGIVIPQNQVVSVQRSSEDVVQRTTPAAANEVGDTYITSQTLNTNLGPQPTQTAVQDKTLPFPAKPTQANKIVGMTLDPTNTPLSNVIIEILTADGVPARAVKTNILGQFFITTPLSNGMYTISAEKEGYTFPPQSLELTGQVLDPLEIRSN